MTTPETTRVPTSGHSPETTSDHTANGHNAETTSVPTPGHSSDHNGGHRSGHSEEVTSVSTGMGIARIVSVDRVPLLSKPAVTTAAVAIAAAAVSYLVPWWLLVRAGLPPALVTRGLFVLLAATAVVVVIRQMKGGK